nr:DUF4864 domain-containing protein [Pseudaestuariivita rosea]
MVLPVGAHHEPQADIQATIDNQIAAFRADDFETAFTYASPGIQQIFRTPENFGTMVRQGYPMVWRPEDVRFLELREVAGNLWQRVQVTDAAGRVHTLDYQMIQTDEGWKINGVQLLQTPDVGT